jgi:D-lactate dehydrogenase
MEKSEQYGEFVKKAQKFISGDRIYTDDLRLLAWGTDAGFYRLLPKVVVRSQSEEEVSKLLKLATVLHLSVTFRAAGTSLSGQSISDSILIVAGENWEQYTISPDAEEISMQPGLIGQRVNDLLRPFGRKFSPDPASIKSAMVGGIVINNASGMNCGIHANSDKMLISDRIVLVDGTVLDTRNTKSRDDFSKTHPRFLKKIMEIHDRIGADEELVDRIRYKYSIKNVTGLNLLPFVRFDDPFDIIAHLMIGSEGTLAFLSNVTMHTEKDYPCKASALVYFGDIKEAARAVVSLKSQPVFSAEFLDSKSLQSVNDTTAKNATAILIETKGFTSSELKENIDKICVVLKKFQTIVPIRFTDKEEEYARYWAVRSGVFPAVGGTRELGTTCLIEDVAFHIADLPEAVADLQALLSKHNYNDACIYGHALEGNFHFIINQSFNTDVDTKRYEEMIRDVVNLVVHKYDGSLKAEHGTGRNMAPFVVMEWGEKVFSIMREVKELFDPEYLLNPGVIFNDDPRCYLKNFKPLPITSPLVDKCIECGFCEVNCVTCGFTLSSRQRIVVQREISRLKDINGERDYRRRLINQYKYLGDETCAGDGLCSMSCPMGINVADLTHEIRADRLPVSCVGFSIGDYVARHFSFIKRCLRPILVVAEMAHKVLGDRIMYSLTHFLHQFSGRLLPQWSIAMPRPYFPHFIKQKEMDRKVVYFPSCINQTMGYTGNVKKKHALIDETTELLQKAGYQVIFPQNMKNLCCGTIWESKGMPVIADRKVHELDEALRAASNNGEYPILCDQSPCLHRMRQNIKDIHLYEPAEFINKFLVDRLVFLKQKEPVAIHITCSMRRMGLSTDLESLAGRCSEQVVIPEQVGCCGFAGDKGFTNPEVNDYALRHLKKQIVDHQIHEGYSNSRTCEIGLTSHSGIPYDSIVYLVNKNTVAK